MNHQDFIDNWSKIKDRQAQLEYLKNYMFSLDGDALFEWMTETYSTMFSNIQKQLKDKNLTSKRREELESSLDSLNNLLTVKKAA
jgi:hypothetical protein